MKFPRSPMPVVYGCAVMMIGLVGIFLGLFFGTRALWALAFG